MEKTPFSRWIANRTFRDTGIDDFRKVYVAEGIECSHPIFTDQDCQLSKKAKNFSFDSWEWSSEKKTAFAFSSSRDFVSAYQSGKLTPLEIAERIVAESRASQQGEAPMGFFISQNEEDLLQQAKASTLRYKEGKTLGPLDGVPIAIKDEVDQIGYATTAGTGKKDFPLAKTDSAVVAKLRAAGALLVGKANMHEIGMGVTGVNTHYGPARNPYLPSHITGGSSSGSAAIVASGLCPISIGADGGGSIRIPASLCGVSGLKATFGRISEKGAATICWSVAHIGPMASNLYDLSLVYSLIAGKDEEDPNSLFQPALCMDALLKENCKEIKIGVYQPWFEHAEPAIVQECQKTLDKLVQRGAVLVPIEIPLLQEMRSAHLISIISEMNAAVLSDLQKHPTSYQWDTRFNLHLTQHLKASDYVHAQRFRTYFYKVFRELFEKVDVIATPTTGRTSSIIAKDAMQSGESNLELTDQIMRFAPVANFLGFPAISVPVGYDEKGLPIGLQLMGKAWQEDLLLFLGKEIESFVSKKEPAYFVDLLKKK